MSIKDKNHLAFLCFALFALGLILYLPTIKYAFVNYDDQLYVSNNLRVLTGFNWQNIKWAFTSVLYFYHPLTWASLMLDAQFFGASASGYHLTNVFLHLLNCLLLLILSFRLTEKVFTAGIITALFLIHPINVETVAWISERKGLLATAFGLATIISYIQYAETGRYRWYATSALLFLAGLMSKPSVIVLPALLLLIDHWKLQRLEPFSFKKLAFLTYEKAPFFLLVIAFCALTYIAEERASAISPLPVIDRFANALISHCRYIQKLSFPIGLALPYYHPGTWPTHYVIAALAFNVIMLLVILRYYASHPQLIFGLLWFLIGLFPTIGIFQIGHHAMADRYAYFPSIGLFISFAIALGHISLRSRHIGAITAAVVMLILSCLYFTSVKQIAIWKNSITLFEHSLRTSPNNTARINLGSAYLAEGNMQKAQAIYQEALAEDPFDHLALYYLAIIYQELKQTEAAAALFSRCAIIVPYDHRPYMSLASIRATDDDPRLRNGPEALMLVQKAAFLHDNPTEDPLLYDAIATAYAEVGLFKQAENAAMHAHTLATNLFKDRLTASMQKKRKLLAEQIPIRPSLLSTNLTKPANRSAMDRFNQAATNILSKDFFNAEARLFSTNSPFTIQTSARKNQIDSNPSLKKQTP